MDHYSLETLAKLHHKELLQEGLHAQSVRQQMPTARFSNRFNRGLLLILSVIVFLYWILI